MPDHAGQLQPRLGTVSCSYQPSKNSGSERMAWRATSLKAMLRREARRGRNDDGIGNPFGVGDRPLQHLHAAQTAAHCRCPLMPR